MITGVGALVAPARGWLWSSVRCWPLSQPSLCAAPASSEAPANNHLYHTRSYTATTLPQLRSGHRYTPLLPLSQVRPVLVYCDCMQYLLYQLHIMWQEVEFRLISSTESSKHSQTTWHLLIKSSLFCSFLTSYVILHFISILQPQHFDPLCAIYPPASPGLARLMTPDCGAKFPVPLKSSDSSTL